MSKDTISRITDLVVEEMTRWCARPLDAVYPVIFIDALAVKIRGGQVTNRPVYVVVGVTVNGERDILGLGRATAAKTPRSGCRSSPILKDRGRRRRVPGRLRRAETSARRDQHDVVARAGPDLHLIRNTFRFASKADLEAVARDLRPIYTATNAPVAAARSAEFTETRGGKYPAIITLWRNAWEEFIPFLDYDVEIRRVICSTNANESLNARCRRAVRARGHFPTEQAALKCLYLVTRSLDPTGRGSQPLPVVLDAQRIRTDQGLR